MTDRDAVSSKGSQDPRWALVERVLASASLQSSPRQQELFRHLAERALQDPPGPVSEAEVGVAVFNRAPDYDTSVDTIVRVQVSQLRKKLEHYFLSEGRDEPVLIELPRGSYVPTFRPRARTDESASLPTGELAAATFVPPPVVPAYAPHAGRDRRLLPLLGLLTIAVATSGWLAYDNARLRTRAGRRVERPHLDRFWGQFLENGLPTQIAVSDGGVLALAEARERSVTLSEYRMAQYPQVVIDAMATDEKTRADLLRTAARGFTPPGDAIVAHEVATLCLSHDASCQIVSARDLRVNLQSPENVILIGHKRANPWLELFEAGMNFRYHFTESPRRAEITNAAPGPGEAEAYRADWGRRGYCVVASLPKPGGRGHALLIFGADITSVEAGGHLLTDDEAMGALQRRLGATRGGRLPYFEVLLQTKLQGSTAASYEVVAHRVIR